MIQKKYHRIGTFFLDSKKILQSQLKHKKVKQGIFSYPINKVINLEVNNIYKLLSWELNLENLQNFRLNLSY